MNATNRVLDMYGNLTFLLATDLLWSEYAIYRVHGCLQGNFFKYHSHKMELKHVVHWYTSFWHQENLEKMLLELRTTGRRPYRMTRFLFMVVQDGLNRTTNDMNLLLNATNYFRGQPGTREKAFRLDENRLKLSEIVR